MRELYPYYERELAYMREMAGEFAKSYPEIAGRLDLERHQCDDPHVERLIEAFCLIASRIHHRLDSEFPEISQALLNLIYPDYLRPVPALSIVQLRLDPDTSIPPNSVSVGAGESIRFGDSCEFRTCYPVELWPLSVKQASLLDATDIPGWALKCNAAAGILLRLNATPGFDKLINLRTLRFCLRGSTHAPYTLYEYLCNYGCGVLVRDPDRPHQAPLRLASEQASAVGFADDECLLSGGSASFGGFRLLQEYLAFPDKFLFFDLDGLEVLANLCSGKEVEILFLLDKNCPKDDRFRRLQFSTTPDSFRLGCTPVANLFRKAAEPLRVDHRKTEYHVQPDMYRTDEMEVFSIDAIRGRSFSTRSTRSYNPLFSFRHSSELGNAEQAFWSATRRHSKRNDDEGTEVFISLVDLGLEVSQIPDETLLVELTCTNRDLPARLSFSLDFSKDVRLRDGRIQWRFLQRPSQPLRPPLSRKIDWRLISLLGMNYLGLTDPGCGSNATPDSDTGDNLKELLALLDFSDSAAVRDRINAIRSITSSPTRALVRMRRAGELVPVYCHGLAVKIDFDEDALAPTGVFLFAQVLNRFLAQYASLNSFTQLTATTRKGRRVLREWKPQAGKQVLL